ncbi:MAG: HTH domain-containing protein [Halobellus sp.]|uniref:HTH domain-containing protein n=1 Tax=Halobellus sp. TaxID=1979212 RepID=UPI0035D5096B
MLSHIIRRRSDVVWSAEGVAGGGTNNGDDTASVETRVELWCKPVKTGGRNEFELVEERLRALSEADHVDTVAVKSWDRYGDDAEGPADTGPKPTLERLRRYAEREGDVGEAVASRFGTGGQGPANPRTGEGRVPRAALVEFEDDAISNVMLADDCDSCFIHRLVQIAERERSDEDADLTQE